MYGMLYGNTFSFATINLLSVKFEEVGDYLLFRRVGGESIGGKNGAVIRSMGGAEIGRHQVFVVKFRE